MKRLRCGSVGVRWTVGLRSPHFQLPSEKINIICNFSTSKSIITFFFLSLTNAPLFRLEISKAGLTYFIIRFMRLTFNDSYYLWCCPIQKFEIFLEEWLRSLIFLIDCDLSFNSALRVNIWLLLVEVTWGFCRYLKLLLNSTLSEWYHYCRYHKREVP